MLINKIKELIENEKNYIENANPKKENIQEISKIARIMDSFLGCNCKYYPRNVEDNDIICGYLESLERSKSDDFIPVIIDINTNLLDAVMMNTVIDSDDDSESILDYGLIEPEKKEELLKTGIIDFDTREKIDRYRKNMLSKEFSNGKELLDSMIENNSEYIGGYELERDELEVEDDPRANIDGFDEDNFNHGEVLIAEIPVENPWEIFAYIPFGGWNDCPGNEDIMAISKYWFEKYGARPFAISNNRLVYNVDKPVDEDIRFVDEFYAFCPDRVDKYMEDFNIGKLSKKIYNERIWYFHWN